MTGLLVEERADAVVLRDPGQDGKAITIARAGSRSGATGTVADAGGAGQRPGRAAGVPRPGPLPHGDRREGAGAGAAAAARPALLAPPPCRSTSATSTTPASSLDQGPEASSAARRSTTASVPTATAPRTRPGSLPTSLRFATGQLKNGADPVPHVPDADRTASA